MECESNPIRTSKPNPIRTKKPNPVRTQIQNGLGSIFFTLLFIPFFLAIALADLLGIQKHRDITRKLLVFFSAS